MWDCVLCGCKMIAGDLLKCPMCFEERVMPKVTIGGASNAAEQVPQAPVAAVVPEAVEPGPADEAPADAVAGPDRAEPVAAESAPVAKAPRAAKKTAATKPSTPAPEPDASKEATP